LGPAAIGTSLLGWNDIFEPTRAANILAVDIDGLYEDPTHPEERFAGRTNTRLHGRNRILI
jgi:hypothetical protein